MASGLFITGTDTNIGKTWATVALMRRLRSDGFRVAGMKPVAAGCEWRDGKLVNQDALLIQQNAGMVLEYEQVNPYAFAMPASPHLACGGVVVSPELIIAEYKRLERQADLVLVEGAGGWLSPLSVTLDNAMLAKAMGLPVLVVVGVRLGCINHARLTFQVIRQAGLSLAGWVAVEIEADMPGFQANLDYISACADAPLWAVLPYAPSGDFDFLAAWFNSKSLQILM